MPERANSARPAATLELVDGDTWFLFGETGEVLATLRGAPAQVRSAALASLVADHSYPQGRWEPNTGGYGYRFVAD